MEVIAINPDTPRPPHPRWFELDRNVIQERLQQKPLLITWTLRTEKIDQLASMSSIRLGAVVSLNRGNLRWRLTLAEGGRLSFRGNPHDPRP